MSWWDPTEEEAEEQYYYYRNKYSEAAWEKQYLNRQVESSKQQLQQMRSQISDCRTQKKNNNRQIEDLKKIIAMLEGHSMFSVNIPDVINTANASLKDMNEGFKKSIRACGINAADLEEAFFVKSVAQDQASARALALLQTEKNALEQLNAQLDSQMAMLNSNMDALKKQISECNAQQAQLQKEMYSYAFDMNHFKKYMYY